jgi:hypothetical protein
MATTNNPDPSPQTPTQAEVLANIQSGRAEWDAVLDRLEKADLLQPIMGDWSARDIIAHITWGENEMLNLLQTRSMLTASPLWRLPLQERNRQMVEANRHQTPAEALAGSRSTYRQLWAELQKLDEADFTDPARFAGMPAEWQLWQLLHDNTWDHYAEHLPPLLAWLDQTP